MKSAFAICCVLFMTLLAVGVSDAHSQSADASELWQTVTLAGDKIGHRRVTRQVEDGRVITRETLVITLQQPGAPAKTTETMVEYVETVTGEPLSIAKTVTSENANHRMIATVEGKTLRVTLDDKRSVARIVPQPFYLREGVRQRMLMQPGDKRELVYHSWNFSTLAFEQVRLRAAALSRDDVQKQANPDFRWKIVRERLDAEGAPATTLYANAGFFPQAEYTTLSGDDFTLVACKRDCALADFTPTTHVYRQLIRSPSRISDQALAGKIRYRLQGDFDLVPPGSVEQQVKKVEGRLDITVCAHCRAVEAVPTKAELNEALAPSYWLPADNDELRQAVNDILPDREVSPQSRMARLTRFVNRHMSDEPDYSGYATALEAYRSRQGDCTEHALLLATLGRAAGVPTRVVLGLVYDNERFLGRRYVFVPHAWVQAWVGDRWVSYDSGMEKFTAGHIALELSQGEPAAIMHVSEQLHRVDIVSAVQVKMR